MLGRYRTTITMRTGIRMKRYPPWSQPTSTSWNTTIGCGFHGGRPPEIYPLRRQVTDRHCAWWAVLAAWSSGGACTRTWHGPRSCRHSQTCISSNSVSNQCGKIRAMSMEGSGWLDYVRLKRGVLGKIFAWRCLVNSSWWALSCAELSSLCAFRMTTWQYGTGQRQTRRQRRACETRSAAYCNCPRQSPLSTRRTATACGPPPRAPTTTATCMTSPAPSLTPHNRTYIHSTCHRHLTRTTLSMTAIIAL